MYESRSVVKRPQVLLPLSSQTQGPLHALSVKTNIFDHNLATVKSYFYLLVDFFCY